MHLLSGTLQGQATIKGVSDAWAPRRRASPRNAKPSPFSAEPGSVQKWTSNGEWPPLLHVPPCS